jgi:hypothetical protein
MRRFQLACNIIIALLGGLPNQLAIPHELVPIRTAGTTLLAAFTAMSVRAFLVTATALVNAHFDPLASCFAIRSCSFSLGLYRSRI